ncbi:hypothetical protein Hanom_Chr16g01510641 [Helianthus anomalus]
MNQKRKNTTIGEPSKRNHGLIHCFCFSCIQNWADHMVSFYHSFIILYTCQFLRTQVTTI